MSSDGQEPEHSGPLTPEEQAELNALQQNPVWPRFMQHVDKLRADMAKAPRVSIAAGKVLDAILNKGRGFAPFPHGNTISDSPTTCTEAVRMAGVKGRAAVNELVEKGLLH